MLPMCRDSNPAGCGAEETRSVFQRNTQGAKRRSESGRRQPHSDIPLGAPQNLRSPLPIRWRAFCYPYAGIRTRQGAELRKRASVFQRSTQGAERRSESGRRQPHADIPLGAPQNLRSPLPIRWRAFGYPYAGIRTRQVRIPASADGPCAKNSKYEYCYQFSNSDFMPSEDNLDAKRPTAEEMQAFISQVLGHMLRNSASFAKR